MMLNSLLHSLRAKLRCQKGQGTVEYALITIAVVIIIGAVLVNAANPATTPLGTAISSAFNAVVTAVNNVVSPSS